MLFIDFLFFFSFFFVNFLDGANDHAQMFKYESHDPVHKA